MMRGKDRSTHGQPATEHPGFSCIAMAATVMHFSFLVLIAKHSQFLFNISQISFLSSLVTDGPTLFSSMLIVDRPSFPHSNVVDYTL